MNWDKQLRRLFLVVSLGVLGHLGYSFWTTDYQQFSQLVHFSWGWFLLAICFAIIPWFWHALRLLIWADFFQQKIDFKSVFQIVVATDLGSAITPSWVGGGPVKVGLLKQKGFNWATSAFLLALASFEDILFYILFIFFAVWWTNSWDNRLIISFLDFFKRNGVWLILIGVLLFITAKILLRLGVFKKITPSFLASFFEKIKQTKTEFFAIIKVIAKDGRKHFLGSFFILVIQWLCRLSILPALVLALGLKVDLVSVFLFQWMIFVAMLFTPTPGAAGGAEATFLLVFGEVLPEEAIAVIMAGWRFLIYYLILILAVVVLQIFPWKSVKKSPTLQFSQR